MCHCPSGGNATCEMKNTFCLKSLAECVWFFKNETSKKQATSFLYIFVKALGLTNMFSVGLSLVSDTNAKAVPLLFHVGNGQMEGIA